MLLASWFIVEETKAQRSKIIYARLQIPELENKCFRPETLLLSTMVSVREHGSVDIHLTKTLL